jgi:hypothetical protein
MISNAYNYLVFFLFKNKIMTSTLLIILRLLENFVIKILIIGHNFSVIDMIFNCYY